MQEIKKFDVLSVAKIEAAMGAVIGFVVGLIMAAVGMAFFGFAGMAGADVPGGARIFFGATAIIALPIVYAIVGFIGGLIVAFLYNLFAGWIGGVKIELV
ncbi:MAG: hypothetical protein HXS41_11890 [Theionarchaea archaeon]|nr:hypothetical protein [Theionarchaea archaeon]MBU7001390.1 hypothetical protein [Theionarchaea archaeon]MBU7021751.1 hypothetical protein [Theionarchaea archaeon]MBU7034507.1 hypothetical protein [Theionarchaea archaeon]